MLAARLAFELETVGVVNQAVENGVGQGRVAEVAVPELHIELASPMVEEFS